MEKHNNPYKSKSNTIDGKFNSDFSNKLLISIYYFKFCSRGIVVRTIRVRLGNDSEMNKLIFLFWSCQFLLGNLLHTNNRSLFRREFVANRLILIVLFRRCKFSIFFLYVWTVGSGMDSRRHTRKIRFVRRQCF